MNPRKRPRAINRTPIIWDGDDGDDVTAIFSQLGTRPWDATTLPHDGPSVWYSAPPAQGVTFTGRQSRSVMTVYPPAEHDPGPTREALRGVEYLEDQVIILRRRVQLDRISEAMLAMLPALPARHTAREIVSEAALLLRHEDAPWEPMPLDVDLREPQEWGRTWHRPGQAS